MPRATRPFAPDTLRAAKLSRVPGVTIAEACARFGVPRAAVERARRARAPGGELTLAELALAALTHNGRSARGTLGDLASIAGWIDYVNHDGCDADDVRRLLGELVAAGVLRITGERWALIAPWP